MSTGNPMFSNAPSIKPDAKQVNEHPMEVLTNKINIYAEGIKNALSNGQNKVKNLLEQVAHREMTREQLIDQLVTEARANLEHEFSPTSDIESWLGEHGDRAYGRKE